MDLLERQIAAIRDDRALRGYGAALALIHVVTVLWWFDRGAIETAAAGPNKLAICWPLVPHCEQLRFLGPGALKALFVAIIVAAVLVAALFARARTVRAGFYGLFALNVVKVFVLALDFRLRMNQHYMGFAATAAFLFVPDKRAALSVLVCLFYVWAGTLKLNEEWISGAALYKPVWFFHGEHVRIATTYVIVLELGVAWGLLARRGWLFWPAFAQLVVFHVFSWPVVSFFYPLLMFALLSIYPMMRAWPRPTPRSRPTMFATAAAFSLLQLVPYAYPGDHALTGEGRLYALHMFDARVRCQGWADVRLTNGRMNKVNLVLPLDTRIACDPIVFHGNASRLCAEKRRLQFVDLDLHVTAARATDPKLHPLIDVKDFCAAAPTYSAFLHNDWILAGR